MNTIEIQKIAISDGLVGVKYTQEILMDYFYMHSKYGHMYINNAPFQRAILVRSHHEVRQTRRCPRASGVRKDSPPGAALDMPVLGRHAITFNHGCTASWTAFRRNFAARAICGSAS